MSFREREEGTRRANDGIGINSNASSAQRDAFNARQHELKMRDLTNTAGRNTPILPGATSGEHAPTSPATLGSTAKGCAMIGALVFVAYAYLKVGNAWSSLIAYGCVGLAVGGAFGVALYLAWIVFEFALKVALYVIGAMFLIAMILSFIH